MDVVLITGMPSRSCVKVGPGKQGASMLLVMLSFCRLALEYIWSTSIMIALFTSMELHIRFNHRFILSVLPAVKE